MELRFFGPVQIIDGTLNVKVGPKERVVLAQLVSARGRQTSQLGSICALGAPSIGSPPL